MYVFQVVVGTHPSPGSWVHAQTLGHARAPAFHHECFEWDTPSATLRIGAPAKCSASFANASNCILHYDNLHSVSKICRTEILFHYFYLSQLD